MPGDDRPAVNRRTVLGALAGGGAASLAGCSLFQADEDEPTTELDDETVRDLAVAFAPTLYFDEEERWFPTDPRPYETDAGGETVVDGFDALDGYTERYGDAETPPDPTVFYRGVRYEDSSLAVVQYWYYSAFDQFTTNFHWHDWEVLHVFVDIEERDSTGSGTTAAGEPQLYVASSHSRKVPNNEFLDPDPEMVPRILSELGSHSSALSLNDERDAFQRLQLDDVLPDITNSAIDGVEDLAEIPIAYGLPRDEGSRLPFVVPELDGAPLYDHERLPSVERSDLIDGDLTVRSFDALTSPPTDLPERETGLVFQHARRGEAEADVEYELVPASELEHIEDFTGPQLSFEFSVPDFAEDAMAGHITTTGAPWDQPRYDDPAADISDPNHREALADRYDAVGEAAPINRVFATVTEAVTADEAPEDEGLTTEQSSVEAVAMLESEPESVPTFGGVAVVDDVPEGDHRLTVNGAGVAPHSEAVSVGTDDAPTVAGVDGEIPLVARENATRLEVDPRETDRDLSDLAVEDDFAGRLYDAPLSGPDAVYVHRGGAYTTEVRDTDDEVGAFRVNPADESAVRIDEPRTGKSSLATFLADIAEETRSEVAAAAPDDDDDDGNGQQGGGSENAVRGLERALAAVSDAARRAAERAESDDRGRADEALGAVETRLEGVAERLAEAEGDLPDGLSRATDRRLDQARRRSEQARAAEKL
ncbi:hypothetical protein NGM10_12595 [Halorussus salilacus]|uniref:hypothetical protein n=1 Tax=Halorussus salilacus TaxID=2953750 RepID=UPI0020A093F8|nr:hypothetical protein [Halorussus salilacus]USZ67562.1 hypothetical protein NGM10_12595 [Halorussus salilacus]